MDISLVRVFLPQIMMILCGNGMQWPLRNITNLLLSLDSNVQITNKTLAFQLDNFVVILDSGNHELHSIFGVDLFPVYFFLSRNDFIERQIEIEKKWSEQQKQKRQKWPNSLVENVTTCQFGIRFDIFRLILLYFSFDAQLVGKHINGIVSFLLSCFSAIFAFAVTNHSWLHVQ